MIVEDAKCCVVDVHEMPNQDEAWKSSPLLVFLCSFGVPSMRVVRVQAQPNVSKCVVCALFKFVFLSRVRLIKKSLVKF